MRRVVRVLALLALAGSLSLAPGTSPAAEPRPGSCPAAAQQWSAVEQKLWERFLCRGGIADLHQEPEQRRKLSGTFLENILLDEPWRPALPRQGVRIQGAIFDGRVTLDSVDLANVLWLEDCIFNQEVFLSQTKSSRLISFDGSEFRHALRLNALKLGAGLFLRGIAADRIELWGASIAGPLFLSGAEIDGLFMQQASVAGDVVINGATIGYLQLSHASYGGSIVIGPVDRQPTTLSKMRAESARVSGRIDITDAIIKTPILLRFASVGGNVEIKGGTLHGIDLTGATIAGDLRLSPSKNGRLDWVGGEPSVLRNAKARVIRIAGEAWPPKLDLRGFQFDLLSDGEDGSRSAPVRRPDVKPLLEWLGRSLSYSPQPYQQVAHVLGTNGDDAAAREVRFASREEERRLSSGWRRAWFTAESLMIGYGYHLERSAYWAIGLLIVGVLVIRVSGEAKRHQLGWGIAFSFDRLIPVIKLRDDHAKIELRRGVREYFYIHQVLGYLLASFLLAWLGGLTK